MLPVSQILLGSLTPILATTVGVIAYRKLPPFYRVLFIQVAAFLVMDLYASTIPKNNTAIYNAGILIEVGLLFLAAHVYFRTPATKWIFGSAYAAFLILWCLDINLYGIKRLASHAYIFAGLSLTAFYAAILFDHFNHRKKVQGNASLILICLSIFIFFAGTVPYLSMMYYIQDLDSKLNTRLFQYMMVAPAITRYFLVALAFLLAARPHKPSLNSSAYG